MIRSHEKPSSVWSRMKSPLEYKQHVTLHPGSEITPLSGQAAWRLRAKNNNKNNSASRLAKTGDKCPPLRRHLGKLTSQGRHGTLRDCTTCDKPQH